MAIIDKYNQRVDNVNSLACVGLDSDYEKLPEEFKKTEFPQFYFNRWIIDQTHQFVSAFKANIAFYELRGDKGMRELKLTTDYIKEKYPDIFLVCDAKRGDIGNTNYGYIGSVLDWLCFDAMTVHPYLGKESLEPFLARKDKGIIVICRTSNPGAEEIQDIKVDKETLSEFLAKKVLNEWNENDNCLLVVGATYPKDIRKIRDAAGDLTFLMPGIGAQGGDVKEAVEAGLNSQKKGLIINSSRGVIFSENPRESARKLRDEINKYR